MQYSKTLTTKTGRELYLRNGDAPDGSAALAVFNATHAETEYLLTYPDESSMTAKQEAEYLAKMTQSPHSGVHRLCAAGRVFTVGIGCCGGEHTGGGAVQKAGLCGVWPQSARVPQAGRGVSGAGVHEERAVTGGARAEPLLPSLCAASSPRGGEAFCPAGEEKTL